MNHRIAHAYIAAWLQRACGLHPAGRFVLYLAPESTECWMAAVHDGEGGAALYNGVALVTSGPSPAEAKVNLALLIQDAANHPN